MAAAAGDETTTCIPCLRSGESCRNRCHLRQFFHENRPESVTEFESIYRTYNMSYVRREVAERIHDVDRARTFINCLLTNCRTNRRLHPIGGSETLNTLAVQRMEAAYRRLDTTKDKIKEQRDAGCVAKLRIVANGNNKAYVTDNGNYIIDLYFKKDIGDLLVLWNMGCLLIWLLL
ncbi:probable ribose-5-phosphate isomerase 2 [Tanacetum coccineum]